MMPLTFAAMTEVGPAAWIVIGWVAFGVALISAGVIVWDIVIREHRSEMNFVWPITALYWGPVPTWFYFTRERERGEWWSTAKGVSHCGAGCTLGDIAGEWTVYLTVWSVPVFATESGFMAPTSGPLAAAPHRRQPGLLVHDADRDGGRVLHRMAGEKVADPARDQGGDVSRSVGIGLRRPRSRGSRPPFKL